MKKYNIISIVALLFLVSCVTENKKKEDCIKDFRVIKSTTPSPDVIQAELSIQNDTIKNLIDNDLYSEVYFQADTLKTIHHGYGTMLVYIDTISKTYKVGQEYVLNWDKSQRQLDSIFTDFKKEVVFVIEDKNGKVYKIKNHCY